MLPRLFFTLRAVGVTRLRKVGVWTLVLVPDPTFGSLSLAVA